jgi:(p)ppGpp synthase/HD superfamily hydrolase
MSTLERAIALAAQAHEGQVDKAGAPYILHPLRVMLRMTTTDERITAVLHDVVEDCGISLATLRAAGFSETVLAAITAVTRQPAESYEDFVLRAAAHPVGRRVKIADLLDNSDLTRIAYPTARDHERLEKYRRALATLQAMESGPA